MRDRRSTGFDDSSHREVQRLQWFLSESAWDGEQINERRVGLLCEDVPARFALRWGSHSFHLS